MHSGNRRFFQVPTYDATKGLMTKAAVYNAYEDEHELAYDDFELYRDPFPRTLSQQLIDDLANLRKNTTIVGRNPAEEALCRLMRPLFEPGAELSWPPAPHRDDSCADRYSEESSSPSDSCTSQRSRQWDEEVFVVESPELLRGPQQCYDEPYYPPFSRPRRPVPAPAARTTPRIIDPLNQFSYDTTYEDKNKRIMATPHGMIFAPVPQLSTAAVLANFEAVPTVPTVGRRVEKEPAENQA